MSARVYVVVIQWPDVADYEAYSAKRTADERAAQINRQADDDDDMDTRAAVHTLHVWKELPQ